MKINIPSKWALVLSLIGGAIEVLNQTTFGLDTHWKSYLTIADTFLLGLGIAPLIGPAFRNALHLPTSVSLIITSGIAAVNVAVTYIPMGSVPKSIITGVLAFLAGIGFGPQAGLTIRGLLHHRPAS